MSTEITKNVKKLPTLAQLNLSPDRAFKNDAFKQLVNKQPKKEWLKTNKLANNSSYLPIDKTEFLLDMIFQEWKCEILNACLIVNSIMLTIRLHYLDPVTGEWKFHDGIGAKDLQMNAGAVATDITQMKPNAVMLAAPIAKSSAIKDASHHLGRIFGRDLNRKDIAEYRQLHGETNPEKERFKMLVENADTLEELEMLKDDAVDDWQQLLYKAKLLTLATA